MLEQIFGSQTRVKLLQLFLNNPGQSFYVRELTRVIGSQINAVRRELENLVDLGVIVEDQKSDKKDKMKYYSVVTGFILYPELKSMLQKAQFVLEKEFALSVEELGSVKYLVLTGSFVGEKGVPIDFLVVGDVNKTKLKEVIKSFEAKFNREINYTLLDEKEFNYRKNVADKFLFSVLDGKKIVIKDEIFNNNQIIS